MEEWRDIKGYEGLYRISNCGKLQSNRSGKWKVLSTTNKKGEYLSVVIYDKSRKPHSKKLHRLVYETFVGEIKKCHHIHHKDGNKQNNNVENLLMMDEKTHNLEHINRNPNIIDGMRYYNKYIRPETIQQFSLDGRFIAEYPNAKEAYRKTGVCSRNILMVAQKTEWKPGKTRKQAGGYIWRIKECS